MQRRQIERDDGLTRLRKAHGQLGGLIHMIEDGRDSAEVLTLLAAVTHALHRAGFRLIADGLERCRDNPADNCGPDMEQLERLFLALG